MLGLLDTALAGLLRWYHGRELHLQLEDVDERTLRDIGMTRRELECVIRQSSLRRCRACSGTC